MMMILLALFIIWLISWKTIDKFPVASQYDEQKPISLIESINAHELCNALSRI